MLSLSHVTATGNKKPRNCEVKTDACVFSTDSVTGQQRPENQKNNMKISVLYLQVFILFYLRFMLKLKVVVISGQSCGTETLGDVRSCNSLLHIVKFVYCISNMLMT
jgi:hypothetical protein